ncbi:hypothetical protein F0L74_14235 [Chitinophaga agrisoli]|uniref:Prokaryotic glutathione synthetase ATP-binding domain-containing protein n=1 Tax=Chitinophaga agrisoli TaxID=2607653 RepID=A0A5B2VYC1_9BACT|nr:hypothetical protein [Chitinophaga agrisoli]KAA2243638.1 hypothetical protein F0L74_14235 [Chitinophaga agrisoli]
MKIAYVCYQTQEKYSVGTLDDEESLLLGYLANKGLPIERVVWNDPSVRWEDYGLALIKAPWDYHEQIGAFYQWLDKLQALGIPLLNPHHIIKWNSDKHYLMEVIAAGFAVIPSAIIENGAPHGIAPFFHQFNTAQLILKPCVSAGAKHTYVITPANVSQYQEELTPLLLQEAFLVQPFIQEIETQGEWSFIFLNGQFSHAVIKRPRTGDFRVQPAHGGTTDAASPAEEHLHSAARFAERFAKDCLYARVDGVIINGVFTLMELELIEPYLFLGNVENGYERYYQALIQRMPQLADHINMPS